MKKSAPLPRDISRFKKLAPEAPAVIRKDADQELRCLSSVELINEAQQEHDS